MNKKQRFEIFKRDNFQCQYCGRKPPNVILEIDHIIPKKEGGIDELSNLITACFDCNRGKGCKKLDHIIARPDLKTEIKKLKEQEIQLKEYYKHLKTITDNKEIPPELKIINNYLGKTYSVELSKQGIDNFKKFTSKLSINEILESIDIGYSKNIEDENRFKYIFGVMHNKIKQNNGEPVYEINKLKYIYKNQPRGSGYLNEGFFKKWFHDIGYENLEKAIIKSQGLWANLKEEISKYYTDEEDNG